MLPEQLSQKLLDTPTQEFDVVPPQQKNNKRKQNQITSISQNTLQDSQRPHKQPRTQYIEFKNLELDLVSEILSHLNVGERNAAITVCRIWFQEIIKFKQRTLLEFKKSVASLEEAVEYIAKHQLNHIIIPDRWEMLSSIDYISDLHLLQIAENCPGLQQFELGNNHDCVTDRGISFLAKHCSQLRYFDVRKCERLTNESLSQLLTHCLKLQHIGIYVSDVGLMHFKAVCPNLRSIFLEKCQAVTDRGLLNLAVHCPNLERIIISGCDISDIGLKDLAKYCPNLKYINLANCSKVTDKGLKNLVKQCPRLQHIDISYCDEVTDEGLRYIAEHCPNLQYIDMSYCTRVTERGLRLLQEYCSNLQSIYVLGCGNMDVMIRNSIHMMTIRKYGNKDSVE